MMHQKVMNNVVQLHGRLRVHPKDNSKWKVEVGEQKLATVQVPCFVHHREKKQW